MQHWTYWVVKVNQSSTCFLGSGIFWGSFFLGIWGYRVCGHILWPSCLPAWGSELRWHRQCLNQTPQTWALKGCSGQILAVPYKTFLLRVPCSQRVQVSLWYILIGYFGGLSISHNDTWTLWVMIARLIGVQVGPPHRHQNDPIGIREASSMALRCRIRVRKKHLNPKP